MPRSRNPKVSLEPYSDSSRPNLKYVVRWPGATPGSRRKEKRFALKKDAKQFKEQKEIDVFNKGSERAAVHGQAVDEAKWAVEVLAPYGVTIREAVNAYIDRREELNASVQVKVAVRRFLDSKERDGISVRYRRDLKSRLSRFEEAFGSRIVCELTVPELTRWLEGLKVGPTSRNNFRRNIGVFFEWCAKLSYCKDNPMRRTSRAKAPSKPVEIFSVDELRVVLETAPADLLPALALGAFAGLRVSEIDQLDWRDINFDKGHIAVAEDRSKSASRRFVPMEPALRAWLEPVARVGGAVTPHNLDARLSRYRRKLEKEEKSPEGVVIRPKVTWKVNVLRHSYGSYAIAMEEDAAKVSLRMGHTSALVTFAHYQERTTREEAEAWFGLMPEEQGEQDRSRGVAG